VRTQYAEPCCKCSKLSPTLTICSGVRTGRLQKGPSIRGVADADDLFGREDYRTALLNKTNLQSPTLTICSGVRTRPA